MALPYVRKYERSKNFVLRFMESETAKRTFPRRDQRLAVAHNKLRRKGRDV